MSDPKQVPTTGDRYTARGTRDDLAIALDIGGTAIKAGLIRRDGELLALRREATPAHEAPELVVRRILALIDEIGDSCGVAPTAVRGIGISMAGFVTTDGVVTATAHLSREWIGYDLRSRLLADLPSHYYFALDTPAPTLGEAYYGAGKGIPHFVYVTVSTGIGAGIIADGRIFVGGLGWAGGVGHMIIDEHSPRVCTGCGNAGCLETFAASQGITATAQELMAEHPGSLIHTLAAGHAGGITPRLVFEAAQQGDAAALEVWQRAGHALGIGLVALVNIVSPTRVVVGGGIAQAGDLLLEPARAVVRERAFPPRHRTAQIVQAALGDLSGAYGAAAMVFYDLLVSPPIEDGTE